MKCDQIQISLSCYSLLSLSKQIKFIVCDDYEMTEIIINVLAIIIFTNYNNYDYTYYICSSY